MITYLYGDLFRSPARVLVNTVNTVGVMGKGVALDFKRIYPEMFKTYRRHCESGDLRIGNLYLYKTPTKWILNFPTKEHWRKPSRVEYIEAGLRKFRARYSEMGLTSIAFPQLGCGNGELDFETQVKPLMERYLNGLSIPALVYMRDERTSPPEHRDVNSIKKWLRSEPSALPFDEVWRDILDLLKYRKNFKTLSKGNQFEVVTATCTAALTIKSSDRTIHILSEEILAFWQQLRDFGMIHGNIAPDHRFMSYLLPVFAELPYVEPVQVSTSTRGLRLNPAAGLQVVPPPMPTIPVPKDLFGGPTYAP